MIVAVIVLAVLVAVLVVIVAELARIGVVEWDHGETTLSHYFRGPKGGRSIDIESVPARRFEFAFGKWCVELYVGQWTR